MIPTLFIIIFIITLLGFAISVPLNGFLTSLLISRGAYGTLYADEEHIDSPFNYFDLVGSFCFFFLGFGWGTILPIEQGYISGSYKRARILLAYCAQGLVSIFISLCAIIPSVLLTGEQCIYTSLYMFFANSLYNAPSEGAWHIFQQNASHFAPCSPYAITATLFFISIVYIQTGILCIAMVRNSLQALLYPFRFNIMTSSYSWIIMIIVPLLFCIFFWQFFYKLAFTFIIFCIHGISSILTGAQ